MDMIKGSTCVAIDEKSGGRRGIHLSGHLGWLDKMYLQSVW